MANALSYRAIIEANSRRTGIPPSVIAATLANELEFQFIQKPKDFGVSLGWPNPFRKEPGKISTGLGQIKPETAREIDRCAGRKSYSDADYRKMLKYPENNIAYLTDLLVQNVARANKELRGGFDRTNDYHWLGVIQAHNTNWPVLRRWDPYARQSLSNMRYYYTHVP